ncbi:glycosyltransferase family 2 protein [Pontibacter vulgaris]|uniref:glycosyltransferase family 2 protein n=1 Tax=Pontibacter vulgaris TaxID=2905679 RepID=UPI001FA7439D|nr:glycosyltransferase [Pontibacter vulgaris]
MDKLPLVSVICLCYNHERFIREALDSVLAQTYPNLEILVVDDCSTDNSVSIIQTYLQQHPQIRFISTGQNRGNCAAFNMGWHAATGDFIIDFATDDVLLPDRVEKQVAAFAALDINYGVIYSDAEYISDSSQHISFHSQKYTYTACGDVFADVISRYFICPPTMLMRREVLEYLGGYDESLAYEDFDFWVRSARRYKYQYLPEVTTKRRIHDNSLSQGIYRKGNLLLNSTVRVCEKALKLVRTPAERAALAKRLKYEARHAYLTGNYTEAESFLALLKQVTDLSLSYKGLYLLNKYKIDLSSIRKLYYSLKYRWLLH